MKMTKMSRAIMPGMTNQRGILFGGQMMAWMDEVSGITAKRFTECEVTTVAVEQIKFLAPIPCGVFLDVCGEVVSVGNTSLKDRSVDGCFKRRIRKSCRRIVCLCGFG